jgi:hypothetical protein
VELGRRSRLASGDSDESEDVEFAHGRRWSKRDAARKFACLSGSVAGWPRALCQANKKALRQANKRALRQANKKALRQADKKPPSMT